ncbi:MAG: primosomal protein N' [Saprospiraceae bacterium]|nr:primosomal protein N' [Saprospiraceae bacterium]
MKYVTVILPLAIRHLPTYYVPEDFEDELYIGQRVEVQFGKKKRYAGLIYSIGSKHESLIKPKPILAVLDDHPILYTMQLDLWEWIAKYYCCTLGEVMQAALPSSLKLQSETMIILKGDISPDEWTFNDVENILIEALIHRNEISVDQADDLIEGHHVYPVLKGLLEKEVVIVKERLKESTTTKTRTWVTLSDIIGDSEEAFLEALEIVKKSKHQTKALLTLYDLKRKGPVERKQLQKKAKVDVNVLRALEKKELIEMVEIPFYEMFEENEENLSPGLSEIQGTALAEIHQAFDHNNAVLLNGVTGSGKTHLYIECIKEAMSQGKQSLFLLPEIALTTQLVGRLKAVFGEKVVTYHSGLNDRERATIWEAVYDGHPIVMGARSALFLPFRDLDLIIVDEEHDDSYKQHDPAPRYQARDVSIFLHSQLKAKVILGSATPSLESRWNVHANKYEQVDLLERHGKLMLPEVEIIDLKKSARDKRLTSNFAKTVIENIQQTVESFKQVLIFQNRRGYAPVAQCHTCGWHAECPNCDVSLTYHKVFKNIRCHYCGHREPLPQLCPQCGSPHVDYKGFGTERIEDELKIIFPEYRIARMDYDTAGGKRAREKLINRMEEQEVDILVGTQMITKGLDFDNIGLVVVVSSDQLLFYPHFRTNERAFQMLQQVSGRAGRKEEGSKVLIQGFDTHHPVLKAITENTHDEFYSKEMNERQKYLYPPYFRLIQIEAKHKKPETVRRAIELLAGHLRPRWKNRVVGPSEPSIARIRGLYIRQILIKMEKNSTVIAQIKAHLQESIDLVHKEKGMSGVRFNVDVDP